MSNLKEKKPSLIKFTQKYSNDPAACRDWFFNARFPNGWTCPVCGRHQFRWIRGGSAMHCPHCGNDMYLFAGTIFQDNKLPLYKLLLGLYLFFVVNKGLSAIEMRTYLDVNYKTALLLCRKCRHLMERDNDGFKLDDAFYEADGAFVGAASREPGHQGSGTQKQAIMVMVSTGEENKYPHKTKIKPIATDNSAITEKLLKENMVLGMDRKLNTDGKRTFNMMKKYMQVQAEPVNYDDDNHRMHWLNVLIGNVKNHITGIYHGVTKRDMPLFLEEQAYRFDQRNIGKDMFTKIAEMIAASKPWPRKVEVLELNDNMTNYIRDYDFQYMSCSGQMIYQISFAF